MRVEIELVGGAEVSDDFIRKELLRSHKIEITNIRRESKSNKVALTGLTVAEYFRDSEGQDVMFFIDGIFKMARYK